MKKVFVLTALSTCMLSCYALAESNVMLYGILDGGVSVGKNQGEDTKVQMTNGLYQSNRWGIRGEEDLGSGNTIFFRLESGFKLSNGTTTSGMAFSREAFLGLKGNWGEFAFGRMGALSSDCGPYSLLIGSPFLTGYFAKGDIMGAITVTDRYNNTLYYKSPQVAGFNAHLMYSNGTSEDTEKWSDNSHYYGVGLTYSRNSLNVNLTAEYLDHDAGMTWKDKDDNEVNFKPKTTQLYTLGATYDFGSFMLYGTYQFAKNTQRLVGYLDIVEDFVGGPSTRGADQHGFALGTTIPAFGGTFGFEANYAFGKLHDVKNGEDKYSTWSIGANYVYPLSKRTLVYGYAGYADANKAMDDPIANDLRGWITALGIRHAF